VADTIAARVAKTKKISGSPMPLLQLELLLGAAVLAIFSTYVAGACLQGARGQTLAGSAAMGNALAVGTGLWAAWLASDLSHQSAGPPDIALPMALAGWLCAVLAAAAVLRSAADTGPLAALRAVLAVAACLLVLDVIADVPGNGLWAVLAPQHIALMALSALCFGAAFVLAMNLAARDSNASWTSRRVLTLLLPGLVIVLQILLEADEVEAAVAADHADLSGTALALLAGLAALIMLTVARIVARIERRLRGRNDKLEVSLRAANQNLRNLAFRDPLTRLANRRLFDRRLAERAAKADEERSRLSLLFIDLDGFKPVNDCYGHASGDRVLQAVAERLRRVAPAGGMVARLGGDEFVLLVTAPLNTGEASMLASRILVALRAPFAIADTEVNLSASIGIAAYPDCGALDKLLACGDAAMYVAKRSGGSSFTFFEQGMDGEVRGQAELIRDLRKAIELNQFELHYQPKIDAHSGQVTAVEALLRWNHATRGVVSPDLFIPLAESMGLIGAIGDWVFERACRQIREWETQGVRMRVAVNLSAQQLLQPGLVGRIEHILQRCGVAPELLTCEVTETAAMGDARQAQRALVRLGRLGVKVSIDDFGTGHSSLAYLRQLPATELKIDRSFVADLETSKDARSIVEAVVRLAHALELRVVAEGVETKGQRNILQALGCDEFQGYLFARPLPAASMLAWIRAERDQPLSFRPSLFIKSILGALN
jgi:diguanylate cyclase